jgi:hypothetical protein
MSYVAGGPGRRSRHPCGLRWPLRVQNAKPSGATSAGGPAEPRTSTPHPGGMRIAPRFRTPGLRGVSRVAILSADQITEVFHQRMSSTCPVPPYLLSGSLAGLLSGHPVTETEAPEPRRRAGRRQSSSRFHRWMACLQRPAVSRTVQADARTATRLTLSAGRRTWGPPTNCRCISELFGSVGARTRPVATCRSGQLRPVNRDRP